MMGRSSRSRGVCEGVLYIETIEKVSHVRTNLRNQLASEMLDLERVMTLIEKK